MGGGPISESERLAPIGVITRLTIAALAAAPSPQRTLTERDRR